MPSRDDPASLELTRDEMQAMARLAADKVIAHLASLDRQPTRGQLPDQAYLDALREPPPEDAADFAATLDALVDEWVPRSFNTASPGYLAFIPGGGLFPAAVAAFVADATNRYTGLYNAAPALVELEANALDWLRAWMGMPAETRGLLQSGGSLATFAAVIAARERMLGAALREGVAYHSDQAHHCITKALRLAGIFPDRVRVVASDERRRMRLDRLAEAIDADRAAGLRPFLVITTAGTTNTGAVDPLAGAADLCRERGLWHHVDGAYGGFFRLVPELGATLAGMERADSLVLDPHKGLFLPYGVGAVLVRDGEALRAAHAVKAGYLPPVPGEAYSPSDYGPELSREFRGLRLWLPLKFYGAARFRAALREKWQLARFAYEALAAAPDIALDGPPELSLFAFHVRAGSLEADNRATKSLCRRVTAKGRAMITGALVGERFLARICVLSFRTRHQHVADCVADVLAAARELR